MYFPSIVIVIFLVLLISLSISVACLLVEKSRLKRIIRKLEGVEVQELNDRDWGDAEGHS